MFNFETWFPPVHNVATQGCYFTVKYKEKFLFKFVADIEEQDGIVCYCYFTASTTLE
jgi:hypothetical protein